VFFDLPLLVEEMLSVIGSILMGLKVIDEGNGGDDGGSGDVMDDGGGSGDVIDDGGGCGNVIVDGGGSGDVIDDDGGSGDVTDDDDGSGDVIDDGGGSGDLIDDDGGGGGVISCGMNSIDAMLSGLPPSMLLLESISGGLVLVMDPVVALATILSLSSALLLTKGVLFLSPLPL